VGSMNTTTPTSTFDETGPLVSYLALAVALIHMVFA
jgi:hypothetical protein